MNRNFAHTRTTPEMYAVNLRHELNLEKDSLITNLEKIVTDYNVKLINKTLTKNIIGACKVEGLHRLIVISDTLLGPYRHPQYRFTLAHEFGHLIIHEESCICTLDDIQMQRTKSKKEREANQFAAEFLFPTAAVKKELRTGDITLHMIEKTANKYQLSLLATTIRLVSHSQDDIAAFYQEGSSIKWAVQPNGSEYSIVETLQSNSLSKIYGIRSPMIEDYVQPSAWFTDEFDTEIQCIEQTKVFKNRNAKLSIVRLIIP